MKPKYLTRCLALESFLSTFFFFLTQLYPCFTKQCWILVPQFSGTIHPNFCCTIVWVLFFNAFLSLIIQLITKFSQLYPSMYVLFMHFSQFLPPLPSFGPSPSRLDYNSFLTALRLYSRPFWFYTHQLKLSSFAFIKAFQSLAWQSELGNLPASAGGAPTPCHCVSIADPTGIDALNLTLTWPCWWIPVRSFSRRERCCLQIPDLATAPPGRSHCISNSLLTTVDF